MHPHAWVCQQRVPPNRVHPEEVYCARVNTGSVESLPDLTCRLVCDSEAAHFFHACSPGVVHP
eukprot:366569-Chlamydomonas_euryale.AAC.18